MFKFCIIAAVLWLILGFTLIVIDRLIVYRFNLLKLAAELPSMVANSMKPIILFFAIAASLGTLLDITFYH